MKQHFLFIGCFVILSIFLGTNSVSAQLDNKNDPVKIIKVNAGTDESAANWLDSFNVEIENTSGKSIKFIQLEVEFIGREFKGNSTSIILQQGSLKADRLTFNTSKQIRPSEKAVLRLADKDCYGKKELLAKSGYVPVSEDSIKVSLGKIVFSDSVAWSDGVYYSPDSSNKNRWVISDKVNKPETLGQSISTVDSKYTFQKASFSAIEANNCGVYTGFEALPDCCPNYTVFSDTIDTSNGGNAQLYPVQDNCPYGGGLSCVFYSVGPCSK